MLFQTLLSWMWSADWLWVITDGPGKTPGKSLVKAKAEAPSRAAPFVIHAGPLWLSAYRFSGNELHELAENSLSASCYWLHYTPVAPLLPWRFWPARPEGQSSKYRRIKALGMCLYKISVPVRGLWLDKGSNWVITPPWHAAGPNCSPI